MTLNINDLLNIRLKIIFRGKQKCLKKRKSLPTANVILNGEKAELFPSDEAQDKCAHSHLSYSTQYC